MKTSIDDLVREAVKRSTRAGGTYTLLGARELIDAFLNVVAEEAFAGKFVPVPGFGTFSKRPRRARTIAHPQTKQRIEIGPTWALGFSAAKNRKGK